MIAFSKPSAGEVVVQKRLPLLPDDKVFLLHPNSSISTTPLDWVVGADGKTTIRVPEQEAEEVRNAWAFRIMYSVA